MLSKMKELEEENRDLRHIVKEILPWSRRYCDMRQTYAVGMHNDAVRLALKYIRREEIACNGAIYARDGGGRRFDRLPDEEVVLCENDNPAMWTTENYRVLLMRILEASQVRDCRAVILEEINRLRREAHTN